MTHSHGHTVRNIRAAFLINLVFAIIEMIGGIYTNSLAIISDALHDFGDSLSLGVAWYLERVSKRGRDPVYSYGYRRFSLLGALITAIVLITGTVIVLSQAIPALMDPRDVDPQGMLIIAILGVVFNTIAYYRLHRGSSINEKMVSLHLLEDVLGWVAVLISSVILIFWYIPVLDPLLSIFISVYIVFNVFRNLRRTMIIMLQGAPAGVELSVIRDEIRKLPEILDVHDLHAWSMDGRMNVITLHIVLDEDLDLEKMASLKRSVRAKLKEQNIQHATIEVETRDEGCELIDC